MQNNYEQALNEIARKMDIGTDVLWASAIRQVYLETFIFGTLLALISIAYVCFCVKMRKVLHDDSYDRDKSWVLIVFVSVPFFIFLIFLGYEVFVNLYNTEYAAFKILLP